MNIVVKILLLCTVFSSAMLVSLTSSFNFADEVRFRENLMSFIEYIKSSIKYRNTPLVEIFASYENEFLRRSGFLSAMQSECPFPDVVLQFCERYGVKGTLRDAVVSFSASLGTKCADEEITSAEAVIRLLSDECTTLKRELPKKIRLNCTVGCCTGLMLVIILV